MERQAQICLSFRSRTHFSTRCKRGVTEHWKSHASTCLCSFVVQNLRTLIFMNSDGLPCSECNPDYWPKPVQLINHPRTPFAQTHQHLLKLLDSSWTMKDQIVNCNFYTADCYHWFSTGSVCWPALSTARLKVRVVPGPVEFSALLEDTSRVDELIQGQRPSSSSRLPAAKNWCFKTYLILHYCSEFMNRRKCVWW